MIQIYKELLDSINRAHKEYVDFAKKIGIDSEIGKKEFMTLFMDYHADYLEGGKMTNGKIDDQRSQ